MRMTGSDDVIMVATDSDTPITFRRYMFFDYILIMDIRSRRRVLTSLDAMYIYIKV